MSTDDATTREELDDENADGAHAGNDTESEEDDGAPADKPRAPRRTVRRTVQRAGSPVSENWHGAIPATATKWGIRRHDEDLGWTPPGAIAERREWPLEELSEQTILDRWGPGEYRLTWWTRQGRGGRHFLGPSAHPVVIRAPSVEKPAVAAPASGGGLPPELQSTFTLMNLLEQQSTAKLAQLGQMVTLFSGGNRGADPAMIELIRSQGEQFREALRAQSEQHAEQVRMLARAIETVGSETEDEEEGGDDRRASLPAPMFKPGEPITDSMKSMFLNWAATNPDAAMGLAKEALNVVGKIAGAVAPPVQQDRRVKVVQRTPAAAHDASPPATTEAPKETNGSPASANQAWTTVSTPPTSAAPEA